MADENVRAGGADGQPQTQVPTVESFSDLVWIARTSPDCLALAVTGSRAAGLNRAGSDYDCTIFVQDRGEEAFRQTLNGDLPAEIDLRVMTRTGFRRHAEWGSRTAWDRYAWSIARFVFDRTDGALATMAQEKGLVPADAVGGFVDACVDEYLNQVKRTLQCLVRGDDFAARLESAGSVRPILQAVFALDNRRVAPYFGYLQWELASRPLECLKLTAPEFLRWMLELVTVGSAQAHFRLLRVVEPLFRKRGFQRRFDEWDTASWHNAYANLLT